MRIMCHVCPVEGMPENAHRTPRNVRAVELPDGQKKPRTGEKWRGILEAVGDSATSSSRRPPGDLLAATRRAEMGIKKHPAGNPPPGVPVMRNGCKT